MDFELDEDQRMLKALVERFIIDRYTPGQRVKYITEAAGYCADNWRLLGDVGLLSVPLCAMDGGTQSDPANLITMMEEFGRGLVVEPVIDQIVVAGGILAATGSPAQKEKWLDPLISGKLHFGLAFAEHDARWSVANIETRMGKGGLTGRKTFAPAHVDHYVVTAMVGDRLGLFVVNAKAPGLTIRPYRLVDGAPACELAFDNVAGEALAGGIAELEDVIDDARLSASAEMLGVATRLFDTTIEYVGQRRQFGVPIGSFQAIQHRLADLYVALEQGRSHVYRAATAKDAERPAAIAAAKAYISEMSISLGEECLQFHGGMGVSDELDIGHGLKRILVLASLFGDAAHETARYSAFCKQARSAAVLEANDKVATIAAAARQREASLTLTQAR